MPNNVYHHEGIYLTYCTKTAVSCNTITGNNNYTITDQAAIKSVMSYNTLVGCNNVTGTTKGIYFSGTASGIELKGNYFGKHTTGLYVDSTANIGQQDIKGNFWDTLSTTILGYKAAVWNVNPVQMGANLFTIRPGFGPVPNSIFKPSGNFVNPSGWFQQSGANNYLCSSNPCPTVDDCAWCQRVSDDLIANDSIENDPYTEETRWMLKQGLYEKLKNYPALLADTVLNNFYLNNQNSTLADFNTIDENKNELFNIDSITASQLSHKNVNAQQYLDSLAEQLLLLKIAVDSNYITTAITNKIDSIQQHVDLINSDIKNTMSLISNIRNNKSDSINTENNLIISATLIQTNDQLVNEIYLTTIAKGIYIFSALQKTVLIAIANQCPMSGGNAVFRARAILALINNELFYNDKELCSCVGISLRKKDESSQKLNVKVYPNPANNKATLEYKLEENEKGKLIITNTVGQIVFTHDLFDNNNQFEFSTTTIVSGIYNCLVISNGKAVDNVKLVIIH